MSIGKRLFNFARSELNSLLDRAAELGDGDEAEVDPDGMGQPPPAEPTPPRRGGGRRKVRLEDLSDAELEAEIERRRLDREINERAARASSSSSSSSSSSRQSRGTTARGGGDPVAKAYAALEVPNGSDFETVRKAYRSLMRKYHPDRHTASPEKQKAANELAQKLTAAYDLLEKRLRK